MSTRPLSKRGSWYDKPARRGELKVEFTIELDQLLNQVPETVDGKDLPIPSARVIIAPHAGIEYSGACAAWAYRCFDPSKAKRVFLLGPSHTYYLEGLAVTTFTKYATPFGDLDVDIDIIKELRALPEASEIKYEYDVAEHSLELHLGFLYKRFQQTFGSPNKFPKIVPALVGDNSASGERALGQQLAPYLKDPENAFIISSDFCHWGSNFSYTPYSPTMDMNKLQRLDPRGPTPNGPPIHESIKFLDDLAIAAIKTGKYDNFHRNLRKTKNTVCGRHPIGAVMAGLEELAGESGDDAKYRFNFVRYERSNEVIEPDENSVSYVSAYAVA